LGRLQLFFGIRPAAHLFASIHNVSFYARIYS
jgi:hypothetical protein